MIFRSTPENETLTRLATELDIQPDTLTGMTQIQTKDLCRVLLDAQSDFSIAGPAGFWSLLSYKPPFIQASPKLGLVLYMFSGV